MLFHVMVFSSFSIRPFHTFSPWLLQKAAIKATNAANARRGVVHSERRRVRCSVRSRPAVRWPCPESGAVRYECASAGQTPSAAVRHSLQKLVINNRFAEDSYEKEIGMNAGQKSAIGWRIETKRKTRHCFAKKTSRLENTSRNVPGALPWSGPPFFSLIIHPRPYKALILLASTFFREEVFLCAVRPTSFT